MSVVSGFTGHYSVVELEDMAELREILGDGADRLNWLFLSTSGVHGSYTTLNDVFDEDGGESEHRVTVLVVQPRMVRSFYGHIQITEDDVPWLRQQVAATLLHVEQSQADNVAPR